jgi:SPP1 family phage portal protein
LLTFQDFQKSGDKAAFAIKAIQEHKASEVYRVAVDADAYDRQLNTTILEYTKKLFTLTGEPLVDFTASNNKITSNYFRRLNSQRNSYLLGNGVTFEEDSTKEKLGQDFDGALKKLGYKALIHGVSFGFWNVDNLHVFPVTEFVPFWDENTGALMAGIRFWQLDTDKPLNFVIYEIDGYAKYRDNKGSLETLTEKRPYKERVQYTPALGEEVVGGDNYSALPIIPMYGSELKQSTLVGMKRAIDSYDLIRSGFANDLTDCAQIYWLIKNAGGMDDNDLARFRDRLKFTHIAGIDTDGGAGAEAVTQEIPYAARTEYLERIRNGIYEDFGAFDVSRVSASAKTATEINAAYQPLDETADDYEYQVIEFIQQLLNLIGIEDNPTFKRNRIANQLEQTQMVLQAATYIDERTVLNKLPWLTPDEVENIMERKANEEVKMFNEQGPTTAEEQPQNEV